MKMLLTLALAVFATSGLGQSQPPSSKAPQSDSDLLSAEDAPRVEGRGTVGFIPKWTGRDWLGNSLIFQSGGSVGIGTQQPEANLDVRGTGATAIQASNNSTAQYNFAVYGQAVATAGNAYGVGGTTFTTGYGAGVIGSSWATSGSAYGGFFQAVSPDGNALFAYSSATSGQPTALVGEIESPNGVAGRFTAHSGSGLLLLGLSGSNYTNVFSVDAAGDGFFAGNLNVNGTISKGGGSFKIDDPIDPGNKTLSHSFVESPDMMNIYNGNVVTDTHAHATIDLPAYFEALNRDFRYQLTVIGQFAEAIVIEKVQNNRFVIESSKPNVEVSWQITGVRQDAYANTHRIPVEELKSSEERGHYLHAEASPAPR